MAQDKYKLQFAELVAAGFRQAFPETYAQTGDAEPFTASAVYQALAKPKDATMGRFAYPVFRHAGPLKAKPPEIAQRVAAAAETLAQNLPIRLVHCVAAGGFLNGQVDPLSLIEGTLSELLSKRNDYASADIGNNQTCLVEYSSPNIAKPFGVGHLRSTVLGHTLRRILKKVGYNVVGINYPGDWGTQFGKMIVAYRQWGDETTLQGNAVKNLLDLYVKYHIEADRDKSLDDASRRAFKELEQGEPEAVKLWQSFKKISHAEFERVYGLLGIEFDWVYGEADLNDRMEPMIARFERARLSEMSQGALVVHLGGEELPPVLLKKADGATLYATRDLAGMVYRWEKYPGFHRSLYIVNTAQSDHFKQIFKAMSLLEEAENVPVEQRMSGRMTHVDFGWVRFGGKTMSTRRGNLVLLEDLIQETSARAKAKIQEKNPALATLDQTAHQIGIGAVLFTQLSVRRQRDVDFNWEEALSFEGETGPYLQYTHARLCSLMRRYGRSISPEVDFSLLNQPEELRVVELLADFPQAVLDAAEQYEPFFVSTYLLRLAGAFNKVYQRKDAEGTIDKIVSDDEPLTRARLALVLAVQTVINEGLRLLGMDAPEEM